MFEWIDEVVWRRMLRAGLEHHVGLDGVTEAIAFWNAHFSDAQDRQKHIRPFAQAFTEFIGKPEERTAFALHIIAAMHTKPDALPPDPQAIGIKNGIKATRTISPPVVPGSAALSSGSVLPPIDATLQALIRALQATLDTSTSGTDWGVTLQRAIAGSGAYMNMGIPKANATQVIGAIYVALTDALGPVEADHLLSQAVKDVENSPIGRIFSPRQLL